MWSILVASVFAAEPELPTAEPAAVACAPEGPLEVCDAACVAGDFAACLNLGGLRVAAGDPAGARAAWEGACTRATPASPTVKAAIQACSLAAEVVRESDPEAAKAWSDRGCALAPGQACGPVEEPTAAEPTDPRLRYARLLRACAQGDQEACEALKKKR